MTAILCVVLAFLLLGLCLARMCSLNAQEEERLGFTPERQNHQVVSRVLEEDEPELVHWES